MLTTATVRELKPREKMYEVTLVDRRAGLQIDVHVLADEPSGEVADCQSPRFHLFHMLDSARRSRRGAARGRLDGRLAALTDAHHQHRTATRLVDAERRAHEADLLAPPLPVDLTPRAQLAGARHLRRHPDPRLAVLARSALSYARRHATWPRGQAAKRTGIRTLLAGADPCRDRLGPTACAAARAELSTCYRSSKGYSTSHLCRAARPRWRR
jgi:hypothetical protein